MIRSYHETDSLPVACAGEQTLYNKPCIARQRLTSGLVFCGVFAVATAYGAPSDNDVDKVAEGIRESRQRLLRFPGGVAFEFRVDAEQDKKNPYFMFREGLDGFFAIKWPRMRNRVTGKFFGLSKAVEGKWVTTPKSIVQEADYSFETKTGTAWDGAGSLGQIAGFRHPFTAQYVMPFVFQYFVEMSQEYMPGEEMNTDYWLPNAIEQHPYEIGGKETIEGIPCLILRRRGMDNLWIAEDHGFVVCRRELRFGVGKPLRERTWNLDLKEIGPGIWIPLRQINEIYDLNTPGKRLVRYKLSIRNLNVGKINEKQLKVVLPETMRTVEDFVTGTVSHRFAAPDEHDEGKILAEGAKAAQFLAGGDKRRNPWTFVIILANLAILLGAVLFWVARSKVKRRT